MGELFSAGASIIGSSMQAGAVRDASSASIAEQRRAEEQARSDLQPWRTAGENALGVSADLSGANGPDAATAAMKNYQTSPGYQWQLDQGLRAVDAGAAAKGMTRSGATLKAEQTFGAGLADQDFGQYYNRLFNLSNVGQASAAKQAYATQSAAGNISQSDTGMGNAMSSIYGNTAQGIGNAGNALLNSNKFQNWVNGAGGNSGGGFYSGGTDLTGTNA
jgi:hypothetical protein